MKERDKKGVTRKKEIMDSKTINGRRTVNELSIEKQTFIEEKKSDVICIIGMHRSGTSMVARLLNLCGLDLGPSEQLEPPNESNPQGHFENKLFLGINDALLGHFGGSWYKPPLFTEGWEYDPPLEQIIQEARVLLSTFTKSSQWGWKDPRTTVLLPFWKSLIPGLRFVICIRSPLEVAKSLAKRDRIPIQKGIYLWNQYMRAAIRDTEGCHRIFTFYEDFFKDASLEINRLIDFCGLQKPDDLSILHNAISRELKHHTSETLELLNEDKVITEYKLFYICLRALTRDGFACSKSNSTREDLISKIISKFCGLFKEFHDEQKVAQLQSELADLEEERDTWGVEANKNQDHINNLTEHAENLERIIVDKDSHIKGLTEHAGNLEKIIAEKENQVNNLVKHAGNLEKIIADKDSHINNLTEHAGNLDKIIADKEDHINNLREQLNNSEHSVREKDIQISSLKDFEEKVKRTLLYKLYRFSRLYKIYN